MDDLYNPVGFPERDPVPAPRARVVRVHGFFYLVAFVLAGAGALYAHAWTGSIALPIFVFGMTQFYVGRGLGDVATDRQKLRRFLYFTILPVVSSLLLWGTYLATGLMWLAALVGFVVGIVMWNVLAAVAFTEIHAEEFADTQERQRTGGL